MNLEFLILIAIPLGLYLLVLIAWTRDFSPDGELSPQSAEPVISTAAEVIQDAAVASATLADTHIEGPAVTAPSRTDGPAFTAPDTNNNVADMATTDDATPSADTELISVVSPESREPTPEPTNLASAASQQEIAPIEQPASPAAPQQTAEPNSPGVSPQADHDDPSEPILSGQPLILPGDSPKYAFDYRGRLWVEKKRRGFFRQLRRPQLPPDDPTNPPDR